MMRLGNARTIADIEFIIDGPSFGSDETNWSAFGAHCSRSRHRFVGESYSYSFDVVQVQRVSRKQGWHIVIISELWQFKMIKDRARAAKSLKILKGKSADILGWLRHCRDLKLANPALRDDLGLASRQ